MKGIFFLIYVFVEIVITLPLAYGIGAFYTFLEAVLSALLGISILFNTPFTLQESFQKIAMSRLSLSTFSLASTIRILGAFLLILPGFFGDTVGIVLLIWSVFLLAMDENLRKKDKKRDKDEDIIDVEIVDSDSRK